MSAVNILYSGHLGLLRVRCEHIIQWTSESLRVRCEHIVQLTYGVATCPL